MKADRPPERPPAFTYRRGKRLFRKSAVEMHADAVPLSKLAGQYGTPLYVYSASTIRERYQQFDRSFRGCEHAICYSVRPIPIFRSCDCSLKWALDSMSSPAANCNE